MDKTPVKLYRITDVMRLLSVSRATVYRLVDAGKLTKIKIGRRASRVTAESIDALLAQSNENISHGN
ncbi:helix-turn-helix transcriptional regulator [Paraburkholderia sp. FT54]|uniref:helix-turn-helix transcriptional regulator n=1 Tax=Paraburkholderia sp. FT54 TaxID=3074437 RepID=UPI0038F7B234